MAVRKLVIVMWQADPSRPEKAAAPLIYAACARALDMDVEIHLTSSAVRWAFEGVAQAAYSDAKKEHTIYSHMARCHEMGVKIFVCGMALAENHRGEPFVDLITGQAGAATVIGELQQEDTRVLVF